MTIIISGASSGLGAAIAKRYAPENHNIVLVARRKELLEQVATTVKELGSTPKIIVADVSIESECKRVVQSVLDEFGTVDILVNNAGRGHMANVENTSTEILQSMFSVNMYSTFWLTQFVLPTMIKNNSGYILNVASVAGKQGFPFNAAYVAAKHAVVGFTASLRAELYGTNVHATVICPAGISTDWASVSEGGSIGQIFAVGIRASRTISREKGLPLAPLTPLKSADEIANIVYETIQGGRSNDVFTHAGTQEHAALAATNRSELEDQFAALYFGMQQAYEQT